MIVVYDIKFSKIERRRAIIFYLNKINFYLYVYVFPIVRLYRTALKGIQQFSSQHNGFIKKKKIPATQRLRQGDLFEFKASLTYKAV